MRCRDFLGGAQIRRSGLPVTPSPRESVRARGGLRRSWGPWTEIKLDALSKYLHAFNVACLGKAPRTLYLDLFAGAAENISRTTGLEVSGSALRALQTTPSFSKLLLCELHPAKASGLESNLKGKFPERDLEVLTGDCNTVIPARLTELAQRDAGWRRTPAFAFIDQFSAEIHWETLRYLADYRESRQGWRTELWLYFGDSLLPRGLASSSPQSRASYAERVDRMYGTDQWREIVVGRDQGMLTAAEAKDELVNLMRWRLQSVLGYGRTLPLKMARPEGHGLYTMIFATNHDVGEHIMQNVLAGAEEAQQQLMAATRTRRALGRADRKTAGEAFPGIDDQLISGNSGSEEQTQLLRLDEPVPPWRLPVDEI
ncbi:MAG: three-Cys-motif partner protein TcmP [Actinobacteria bacterium]|nr:three-Cys-motif partner protein TcmP [Actinomycetota bacterium]